MTDAFPSRGLWGHALPSSSGSEAVLELGVEALGQVPVAPGAEIVIGLEMLHPAQLGGPVVADPSADARSSTLQIGGLLQAGLEVGHQPAGIAD